MDLVGHFGRRNLNCKLIQNATIKYLIKIILNL